MKSTLTLLLCILAVASFASQPETLKFKISGQAVEKKNGNTIPYATVIIENDSLHVKKAVVTDASGKFSHEVNASANYWLTVIATGNQEIKIPVTVSGSETNLGKLEMEEAVVQVGEVKVSAQKSLVKVEPDKIVYRTDLDPDNQTNNALEMLRKVPLVTVDAEENITVNGQSNFKVLLNGKSTMMMSNNLKEVLKSMPANTIKDIEIITNPSSKYDAEGVGGIINIITTKKTISGYNGSLSSGIDSRGGFNGNVYLAAKIKKFSFSARYYGSQYKQPGAESKSNGVYFTSDDYHYSTSSGSSVYKGFSSGLSGEASYDIDSLNLISLSFWGYQGSSSNDGFSEMSYSNLLNEITRNYLTERTGSNKYGSLSGSIDYQRTYKKPDKSLTFSYKLDNSPRESSYNTEVKGIKNYPSYRQRSENTSLGREQTLQVDYFDPITKVHQVEGGVKFILRENASDALTYRNDTLKLDNVNNLDYDQYILGTYLGYLLKFEKFSVKTGMRLERTWNNGVSKTQEGNTLFTNRLFNLIPYITFSYMPKQGQTLKLSYTQRLSRPDIWYLNPYVNDADSMNISYGNPKLESEVSHSFEFNYSYFTPKFNLSLSPFAYLINNSIESLSKVNPNGSMVTTYENIGKNQRYGLNIYFSLNPSPKLNIYLNGSGAYSNLEANNGYAIANKGFNYRGYLGGRASLWKDGNVSFYGGIFSPEIMLQGKSSLYYYTGLGISQYFFKRKLMLSLSANDPFWSKRKYSNESKDVTFTTYNETVYPSRTFRFSVTYNFGQMGLQVKKASRGIQNDDKKSGGGSSEGGSSPQ